MPQIFISYRREDTSGDAGHLAEDLEKRFGRRKVFIDIDKIAPGTDFDDRIQHALARSKVTFVLIGKRWLEPTHGGIRRLDDEEDYVRREIVAAIGREDVAVVPVLVGGASMPSASALPRDMASLARRQASELTNSRWRYDVKRLCKIAQQYDRPWFRIWRGLVGRPVLAVAAITVAIAGGGAALIAGGGSPSRSSGSSVGTTVTDRVSAPTSTALGLERCGPNISAEAATTSCPFAMHVFISFWRAYRGGRVHGPTTVAAYSPATGVRYQISCTTQTGVVNCSHGTTNNALVTFPLHAVTVYAGSK
jgi:hypothetical protein